ncbi:glycoside hydrolase, partial [Chytriomyces sp. MP71]
TFDEVWDHWDGACGGGLYWGRDRKSSDPKVAFLKSTITNAEMMEIAARLFALTGESGYKSRFNQIWGWLKTSGIVTVDYYVADGVDSRDCQPSLRIYSYHVGELLSAHSAMYSVTKDEIYRTEA